MSAIFYKVHELLMFIWFFILQKFIKLGQMKQKNVVSKK